MPSVYRNPGGAHADALAGLSVRGSHVEEEPGFAAVSVLTLAVAIGSNAVVFSVMNGLILRPLNVPESERLYTVERAIDGDSSQSYPNYLDLRDRNRSFSALAVHSFQHLGLDTGGNLSSVWAYGVSRNYFDALGIQAYLGRLFHGSDEHGPNSAPYIVLTHSCWHRRFNH